MVVLGFKKFKGKDNKKYCHLYVERDFGTYEVRNSEDYSGKMIETIWIPDNIQDSITDKVIGKTVTVVSEYVGGRTYINDVIFS